jgi:hypothetical protein
VTNIIRAPWTEQQCDALNRFQRNGKFHPFTCAGGDRTDAFHTATVANYGLSDAGQLHATLSGWICNACDYTQDWAFTFMVEYADAPPLWSKSD